MEEFLGEVKKRYKITKTVTCSITVNWRGIWSARSAHQLLDLEVISKNDLALISLRALQGTCMTVRIFNKSTTTRTGIG